MWLVEQGTRLRLEAAEGVQPTDDERARFSAAFDEDSSGAGSRILSIAGDTAEIRIRGTLSSEPDIIAFLFGGGNTTYGEIGDALAQAAQNELVSRVIMDIDSPGGTLQGLFELLGTLQKFDKPLTARSSGMVASAAYAIASQANELQAMHTAVLWGSIGVVLPQRIDPEMVKITNTLSPEKAPDPATPEGKAMIRRWLDGMFEQFGGAIARGRGIGLSDVVEMYGKGALVVSPDALDRGMIDAISENGFETAFQPKSRDTIVAQPNALAGVKRMTLDELKAQHPGLCRELSDEAKTEGHAAGVKAERERVTAHMTLGESSGANDIAAKAIKEGSDLNVTLQAEYMSAGMKKRDLDTREEDDAGADAGAPAAPEGSDGDEGNGLEASMLDAMGPETKTDSEAK